MSVVTIRRATPEDAELLSSLAERTFRDTFSAQNRAEDMEAFVAAHYSPALQRAELRDPSRTYWLASVDAQVAGFLLLRLDESGPGVKGARPMQLERLYVARPFLGARVGQALMNHALRAAARERCDVIWLGVWERNERALKFYARFGFGEVGEMTFNLGSDPQRDLVLARALSLHR